MKEILTENKMKWFFNIIAMTYVLFLYLAHKEIITYNLLFLGFSVVMSIFSIIYYLVHRKKVNTIGYFGFAILSIIIYFILNGNIKIIINDYL